MTEPALRRVRAAGVGLLVVALLTSCAAAPATTPRPKASAAVAADTGLADAPQDPVAAAETKEATRAHPVRVVIPSIDVDAGLLDLERLPNGEIEAPPSDQLQKAGWYADGTVPGDRGPAVIAGHVDWVDRVAVFHRLGELRPGDTVRVDLSDGTRTSFTVTGRRTVEKDHFPTRAVYGPTPDAQLRLVTCGGPWDTARNIYSSNVVVFATARG